MRALWPPDRRGGILGPGQVCPFAFRVGLTSLYPARGFNNFSPVHIIIRMRRRSNSNRYNVAFRRHHHSIF